MMYWSQDQYLNHPLTHYSLFLTCKRVRKKVRKRAHWGLCVQWINGPSNFSFDFGIAHDFPEPTYWPANLFLTSMTITIVRISPESSCWLIRGGRMCAIQ